MNFPQTAAAMAAFTPLFKAHQEGRKPDRTAPRAERIAWGQTVKDYNDARAVVESAYATELLPTILGGVWKETMSQIREPTGMRYYRPVCGNYYKLFDHPLHFRRVGAKGTATWENTVIVAHPYNIFEDGVLHDYIVKTAKRFVDSNHVGLWARPDLSSWFPGHTALVIAGKNLRDAGQFGFVSMAEAQSPPNPRA
jgi:hypothetical protein